MKRTALYCICGRHEPLLNIAWVSSILGQWFQNSLCVLSHLTPQKTLVENKAFQRAVLEFALLWLPELFPSHYRRAKSGHAMPAICILHTAYSAQTIYSATYYTRHVEANSRTTLWKTVRSCKQKGESWMLLSFIYRKVVSRSTCYYSENQFFGGATNCDMLLNEACLYL